MVRQEGLERPLFAGQAPPGGRLILRSVAGQRLPALGALLADSLADGRHTVRRLIAEWQDGGDRFAGPGKRLLVAWSAGPPPASAARSIPTTPRPTSDGRAASRSRRRRGRGIGRALLVAVLAGAARRFSMLTVHVPDPSAAGFYERCGFAPWSAPPVTHRRRRRAPQVGSSR